MFKKLTIAVVLGVLLGIAFHYLARPPRVLAQQQYPNVQGLTSANTEATSTTNAPVAITISSPANAPQRPALYGFTVRCSAGSANVTVADGATTIWSSDAGFAGTSSKSLGFTSGIVARPGNSLVVTLGACGTSNTGVLDVEASIL